MIFPVQVNSVNNTLAMAPNLQSILQGAGTSAPWFATSTLVRYYPLLDETANIFRMFKSVDGGSTWVEVDATHAPAAYVAHAAIDTTQCWDGSKVYCVYWRGTTDANSRLTLKSFDTTTDTWGVELASNLVYNDGAGHNIVTASQSGIGAAYRPSDLSVVVLLNGYSNPAGVIAFRCVPGGAGWDALAAIIVLPLSITTSMLAPPCIDADNNIHSAGTFHSAGTGTSKLFHFVLHSDGSVSAMQQILAIVNPAFEADITDLSLSIQNGGMRLVVKVFDGSNNMIPDTQFKVNVCRTSAVIDAPAWEITTPLEANPNKGAIGVPGNFVACIQASGQDFLFYTYAPPAGNVNTFAYIASLGPGNGWGAETVIGTVDAHRTGFKNANGNWSNCTLFAVNTIGNALALSFPLASVDFSVTNGTGYFELVGGAAPAVAGKPPIQKSIIPLPEFHCCSLRALCSGGRMMQTQKGSLI